MNENKTQYVLESLEIKLFENIKELAPYYEKGLLGKFEIDKLKLQALIVKLWHRDKTLAKLVYLKNFVWLDGLEGLEGKPDDFQPKRGKKQQEVAPLKFIMKLLKCSHRTAQAYQLTMKGMKFSDKLLNDISEDAASRTISEQSEKQPERLQAPQRLLTNPSGESIHE